LVQHSIDTGNAAPVRLHPRRLPLAKRAIAEQTLREMADSGVIEPASGPWSSPVVLVRKKDESWRFCVDYRRLNEVTRKDSYPLPRIDDALEHVAGSAWFSSLDLRSGYWQVELAPKARPKTAFSIGQGLWQFRRMPFGLCNAPATFERLMEKVLADIPRNRCVVYLDDLLVHGKEFEVALANLREVFLAIQRANLRLNSKKCQLLRQETVFLGHVISAQEIATDPAKIAAVQNWPEPVNVSQLRTFLGLASYYRRFVKNFATIASPLHELTRKNQPFRWDWVHARAFTQLREALVTSPVLEYPDASRMFILDRDASDVVLGAVLSQVSEGKERAIAYFSRALSGPEKNYCVTRRELLAVVAALKHFRPYLYGQSFLLRTDHASLVWLLSFKEPEGQLARWLERLQDYDFIVQHRAGKLHANADALSRRPCSNERCQHCERVEACAGDCDVEHFSNPVSQNSLPAQSSGAPVGNQPSKPACSRVTAVPKPSPIAVAPVPQLDCEQLIAEQEKDPALQQVLGWVKAGRRPEYNAVAHLGLEVDILGPFPISDRGNRYVLVAMDYFTKWPEAFAVPDQSASTTARVLVDEVFSRFGAPERLHSDQGRNFEAEVFAAVCERLGVKKTHTTPLHPQSDGLVERFNRTLTTQLAVLTSARQKDWDEHLPLVLWAYRTAVQESSQLTPAALMFELVHELARLTEALKDELVSQELPSSLQGLLGPPPRFSPRPSSSRADTQDEPMQLDKTRDDDVQWKGLVFTAGNRFTNSRTVQQKELGALEGVTPRRLPDQRCLLPVFEQRTNVVQALVDLGSDHKLINAKALGIPALPLETYLRVQALDGSPLPSITHRTPLVSLRISGNLTLR
ncbi:uncharacterized protein LOC128527651, partial [Clarias gariepinus]|uniref:uncharacterized protein LOC128527651 n=1 Tax=Clarias gariepinus TaxID=13013 RepID=UPI00234C0AF6